MSEIVFDLETKKMSYEVEGGLQNKGELGLSVAVTWDDNHGFRDWLEQDTEALVRELSLYDKVIGFNVLGFDYEVLAAYEPSVWRLLRKKTADLMYYLWHTLGHRVSLDSVAEATLGRRKTGTGEDAVRWFQQGKVDLVLDYCRTDVELTRDIYNYGLEHGCVYYMAQGRPSRVEAQKGMWQLGINGDRKWVGW